MNIAVVGTGYVGLVTGTCLAETGNTVTCVDIDKKKISQFQKGNIPIYEPHLETIFQRNIEQGRLHFTVKLEDAVQNAQVIFLALPTPPGEDGSADLSYILNVSEELGRLIKTYKVIVDKSTVPVGTAEKVRAVIAAQTDIEFDVVSNPEFLREGFAVEDFMKPDRVVIGTISERARKIMEHLFKPYVRQESTIIFMDERSAELTKYAANAFLATKITFMNEIANFCEKMGANVDMIRLGIGADDRIGKRFLFPGIGYGGSCFPKDVKALVKSGTEEGFDFSILRAVMSVNEKQRTILLGKIKSYFKGNIRGLKAAVWGLSFKPDTDDIREAPSIHIIRSLLEEGVSVAAFDPEAINNARKELSNSIEFAHDQYSALKGVDMLIVLTEWAIFLSPDFEKMGELMRRKVIFDGRNVYELENMEEMDFYYNSIGRRVIHG